MEIKVYIDKDTVEANTETSTNVSEIIVNGGKHLSYTHDPVFGGFVKKIIPILKERRNVELKHTVASTGEKIAWVTLLSNSTTSAVFALFRSMGIYVPKIVIGVCEDSQTIYTSSKLCKDLNKYSEPQRAAVVMYMLSIAHFVIKAEEFPLVSKFDGLSGALTVVADDSQLFNCLRTFHTEETWYLKDSNKDEYTAVRFYNSPRVYVNDLYANSEAIQIAIAKCASGKHIGLAVVKFGEVKYTFVIAEGKAYTDFDLCNIEISADSICASIANAYDGRFDVVKSSVLPLTPNVKFLELDSEGFTDFVKSEKIPKWLQTWTKAMFAKNAKVADAADLEYLCKAFGITAPTGGCEPALTLEEMKKQYESDTYAQELYKQIQPYYETYKLGEALDANLKGFSNGALYSMAFVGESGTGKSTAARVIPARCGIPYISVNFSVNIEEADLFGAMTPNPKKSKPEDPEFVWADGIITKAVRNGYCVILEELNFARPGVLGKLNSLLDENRQIDLSTGEIVRAHPNFRIIATCNIAYEGTNRFNKALINRFDDVTVFKDLSRSEAIEVIKSRTKYTNATKISKVYDVYEALKKFAAEQNVNAVVSMRQLLNIFTKGKFYSSAKDAVQRIMINGAFIEDAEYQKVFEDTVFEAFDLKFKI